MASEDGIAAIYTSRSEQRGFYLRLYALSGLGVAALCCGFLLGASTWVPVLTASKLGAGSGAALAVMAILLLAQRRPLLAVVATWGMLVLAGLTLALLLEPLRAGDLTTVHLPLAGLACLGWISASVGGLWLGRGLLLRFAVVGLGTLGAAAALLWWRDLAGVPVAAIAGLTLLAGALAQYRAEDAARLFAPAQSARATLYLGAGAVGWLKGLSLLMLGRDDED